MRNFITAILSLLAINSIAQQDIIGFGPANDGTTTVTCNGFVIDSGGQGGPGYSNNESQTITICPDTITSGDPTLYITVTFNLFLLDGTNTGTQQNPNLDRMTVYDGTSTAAPTLGNYTTNGLQGVSIAATNLNPTGCLTFVFYSNGQGTGQFTASATCTQPCVPPVADGFIVNGDTPDSIRICVGDAVSFDGSASYAAPGFNIAEYRWNFMDGNIDITSGSTTSHAFNAPGQYQVQLTLTDDNDDNVCNNMNVIPLKVYVSNYPTFLDFPPDTTICLGESVVLVGISDFGDYDSTWSGFPTSTTVDEGNMCDDLLGVAQNVPMTYTEFDPSATVQNMSDIQSICINMEHSYMGDLVIQLTCPNGTTINLQTQGGGGTQIGVPDPQDNLPCDANGSNFGQGVGWDYCWNVGATQTWTQWVNAQGGWGLTLPSGSYASADPLSNLIGCPLNGQWQITVIDNWAADDGTVFEFGVTFHSSLYPDIIEFTNTVGESADSSYWDMTDPWITSNTPDLNQITVTPGAAGTYDYNYYCVNNFGCEFDSTISITVTDNPAADAGNDTSICGAAGNTVQLNGGIGAGGGSATCSYTLDLIDSYGDSWNGNTIDVTINGITTNYTVSGTQNLLTLPVSHGDQITLEWNATGSWQSENEFYLYDGNGTLVYSDGENYTTPSTAPVTFTADCFGGIDFTWTPNNGTLNNVNIPNPISTPGGTQEYVLTVFPAGHPLCFTTDTVIVDMGGASDAGLDGTAFFCSTSAPQDLFVYLGGTPQINGEWRDALTQAVIAMPFDPAVLPAGDYEYHVDSLGCTSFSTVTVLTDVPTSTNTFMDADCGACNGEVTLLGASGQGFYEYSIDNGATYQAGDTFTGLCPGAHYFVVRDSLGCTVNDTATVTEINFPSISFNDTTGSDCGTANGEILVNTNSGSAPFTFSMDGGLSFQNDSTFIGVGPGTYDVILNDNFGCADTLFAVVVETVNIPSISFNDTTSADCGADNGEISVSTNSGSAPFTFSIDGGTTFQNNSTFTGIGPGTYDIILNDNFGCADTLFGVVMDSINIPMITLVTATDVDCNSAANGMVDIQGNYITQYSIDGGTTFQAGNTFNGLDPGAYNVMISNDFGCLDSATFTIVEPTPLIVQVTSLVDSICLGSSTTLSAAGSGGNGGPYTFDWYEGTTSIGQGANFTVTPGASLLNYCVIISEACGSPTDTACTTVYIEPVVNPSFIASKVSGCYPVDVTFTNTTVGVVQSSQWYFGDGNNQSTTGTSAVSHSYNGSGLFSVTIEITTPEGCVYDTTYVDFIEGFGYPNASFTFNPNPVSMYDPEVTMQDLSSGNIVSWAWGFPGGAPASSSVQNPVVVYPEGVPAVYDAYLTVVNDYGCIDSVSNQIKVINEVILYAPNAFTPDGDAFNETWKIHIDGIDFYDFNMIIFNRWGERVWESNNPDIGWDGRFMGKLVQDGTYVWILKCKDQYNDKKYTFNGHVTVIR